MKFSVVFEVKTLNDNIDLHHLSTKHKVNGRVAKDIDLELDCPLDTMLLASN